MKPENPYSSPISAVPESISRSAAGAQPDNPDALMTIAKRTFLAWEKLRVIYVLVLVVITFSLGMEDPRIFREPMFWETAILGGVVANLCYLAGPMLDTYVRWLGFRSSGFRIALFITGTAFASLLALVSIATLKF